MATFDASAAHRASCGGPPVSGGTATFAVVSRAAVSAAGVVGFADAARRLGARVTVAFVALSVTVAALHSRSTYGMIGPATVRDTAAMESDTRRAAPRRCFAPNQYSPYTNMLITNIPRTSRFPAVVGMPMARATGISRAGRAAAVARALDSYPSRDSAG